MMLLRWRDSFKDVIEGLLKVRLVLWIEPAFADCFVDALGGLVGANQIGRWLLGVVQGRADSEVHAGHELFGNCRRQPPLPKPVGDRGEIAQIARGGNTVHHREGALTHTGTGAAHLGR